MKWLILIAAVMCATGCATTHPAVRGSDADRWESIRPMVVGMNSWIPDGIEIVSDDDVQAALVDLNGAAAIDDWSTFTQVWGESEILGGLFQSINFSFKGDSGQAYRDDFRKRVWAFEEYLDRYRD